MFRKFVELIPNTLTCGNLVSGCLAIFFAFHGTEVYGCLSGYAWACVMIGLAAVFDFCDGAAARLLKAFSPLGADLDSLSDLVSFGVAPGMLMLNLVLDNSPYAWMAAVCALIPVCGALRLARFNVDTDQATVFRGLPIPANAIFWIGVYGWISRYGFPHSAFLLVFLVLIPLSMVGRFKMLSLKFSNFYLRDNFLRYVLIAGTLFFVLCYGLSGLVWTILLYFGMSLGAQKRL